jgi:hypothetical protein
VKQDDDESVRQPASSHKVYIHRSYPKPRTSDFKCIHSASDSKCISVSCNGREEQSTASRMGYEIEHGESVGEDRLAEKGWAKIGSRRKGARRSAREERVVEE